MVYNLSNSPNKSVFVRARLIMNHFLLKLFVFLILGISLYSCQGYPSSGTRIDLRGEWSVNNCEDSSCRQKHTGSVHRVKLPGYWHEYVHRNNDLTSLVQLERKIRISRDFSGDMLILSLGKIAVADEVRFNGVLIGSSGYFPGEGNPLQYGFAWMKKRLYYIPENLIRYNEDNLLSVRVFSHVISGIDGDLAILRYRSWSRYLNLTESLTPVSSMNAIMLTFMLTIVFLMVLHEYRKYWEMLYSVMVIITVFFLHLIFLGLDDLEGLVRFKLLIGLFPMIYFFIIMFAHGFFEYTSRIATVIAAGLLIVAELFVFLAPHSRFLIDTALRVCLAIITLYILYYTTVYLMVLIKNPRRYSVFLIAAVPLVASTVYTYYYLLDHRFYSMPPVIMFHPALALAGIIFVFILDYKNIRTEKESLAQMLLRKSQRLNKMLNVINRKGAKPEPRDAIYDVIKYLEDNYQETYDRKKLARRFNLNEDYLGQVFRKTTGYNISSFINRKRIEVAKEMLKDTDIRVIDVGYHVGFESLVHFHRIFKKLTGYTPNEYRKM